VVTHKSPAVARSGSDPEQLQYLSAGVDKSDHEKKDEQDDCGFNLFASHGGRLLAGFLRSAKWKSSRIHFPDAFGWVCCHFLASDS
jgi:hypothetical protein